MHVFNTNTKAKVDENEEVDEMNIIHNDYDVVSNIDAVSWLRLIFPFCLAQFAN